MMVFAIGIELANDVTVQCLHDADPGVHCWPMSPWPPSAAPWCPQTFAGPSSPTIKRRPWRCVAAPPNRLSLSAVLSTAAFSWCLLARDTDAQFPIFRVGGRKFAEKRDLSSGCLRIHREFSDPHLQCSPAFQNSSRSVQNTNLGLFDRRIIILSLVALATPLILGPSAAQQQLENVNRRRGSASR